MLKRVVCLSVLSLVVASCATKPKTPEQQQQEQIEKQQEEVKRQEVPVVQIPPGTRLAEAVLEPKNGSEVKGTVTFEQLPNNVIVTYNIEGLPPKMDLGFHIHEMGDCTSDDGKSAGGHFIPLNPKGGTSVENPGRYAGDFQMLHSDETGLAEGTYKTNKITVAKNRAVIGRAVIIHAGPDDVTKPSTPRIACGPILVKQPTIAEPEEEETH